ncbi:serine/threonine-protein kinase tousled-like 1 isoform X2 [Xenia sp. Carnegie-2017]|uniref:serine/threonine-protein kinase tousled-like 1 isoform X2 n=1 Tax=Xenia sp. Carnegie-2017 TaxID=2897299 RepID=UPI001F03B01F|nr:serine/threonine-protein kinase tousled-like 1 isoform X2 [Xenia sp. Carnegie-2017]
MADSRELKNVVSPSQEFSLHLSNESKSHLSRSRKSLQFSSMEGRESGSSLTSLQGLDPQRRELLEARFIDNKLDNRENSNHSNASSGLSESSRDFENVGNEKSEKVVKRKRKAPDSEYSAHPKIGKAESGSNKITGYFPKTNGMTTPPNKMSLTPSPKHNMACNDPSLSPMESSSTLPHLMGKKNSLIRRSSESSLSSQQQNNDVLETVCVHESTQSELTMMKMKEYEALAFTTSEENEKRMKELDSANSTLMKQITELKNVENQLKKANEKCIEFIKNLLIEQSRQQKMKAKRESMNNRLRLGQYVPTRQGPHFVETWEDGFSFKEKQKQQDFINQQKEDIEKNRKILSKRKPSSTV